jgi:hypothetical protein
MQIQDSQSMIQHLGSGGSLMLDKQGQLETQSAAGRFFQKIGDAFRSLTSSGRAAIETRNANLETAMAHMLRRDTPLVNLAQSDISSPLTPAEHNALAMRLGVVLGLNKFPEEAHAAARNLALNLLRLPGVLGPNDSPAQIRGKALEVMNKIRKDPVVFNALRCGHTRNHEQLKPALREIGKDMRAEFIRQKDRNIRENGMHPSFLEDARRGNVRTINGIDTPKDLEHHDFEGEFATMISDRKFRGFLSMMASQAGLEGALCMSLGHEKIKDHPDMPSLGELMNKNITPEYSDHKYDIRVAEGKAYVKLEMNVIVKSLGFAAMARSLGIGIAPGATDDNGRSKPLGGGQYSFEMVVDLTQNMDGKDIPDFELVNASRTPIVIPPPVLIPPPGS